MLEPLSNGESYQNYPSPSDPDFAKRFWRDAYPVLQAVKGKYDPDNAFAANLGRRVRGPCCRSRRACGVLANMRRHFWTKTSRLTLYRTSRLRI